MVWLHRLQAQSAAEFHHALAEVLGDQSNLLNVLHELKFTDGQIVYSDEYQRYVKRLGDFARADAADAAHCCPSDEEQDKLFVHLMRVYRLDTSHKPANQGQLNVVFCIDTTGSMADNIAEVKKNSVATINAISDYCQQQNISFQVGLVTFQDHTDAAQFAGKPEAAWLRAWPLTPNTSTVVNNIQAITIKNLAVGGDYPEDLYAALMCAMNARADWQNQPVSMGWRKGAAKFLFPISDAPPHEPDFEGRTLQQVSDRAAALDPVHCYPLLLPRRGPEFLDPAVRAMKRIADATGGEVVRVPSAEKLPQAMVNTLKLAVRRHKDEVWRKTNPPHLLYSAGVAMALVFLAGILAAAVAYRRRLSALQAATSAARSQMDPRLSGESAFSAKRPPPDAPK